MGSCLGSSEPEFLPLPGLLLRKRKRWGSQGHVLWKNVCLYKVSLVVRGGWQGSTSRRKASTVSQFLLPHILNTWCAQGPGEGLYPFSCSMCLHSPHCQNCRCTQTYCLSNQSVRDAMCVLEASLSLEKAEFITGARPILLPSQVCFQGRWP